jgi:hypothetical protein
MELEKLLESVADKSPNTIKAYKVQYTKLRKALDKDIGDTSQKNIISTASNENNVNAIQALLNIGILVRKLNDLDVKDLIKKREENRHNLSTHVKEKNVKIAETLPSLQDLEDYTEQLYKNGKWKDYIINYLLINYQVRNVDLHFEIVTRKRDANDPNKNYIWIRNKTVTYIRNVYKTAKTYGQKVQKITDPKFVSAIRKVMGLQRNGMDEGVFIPNDSQIGHYIQKATYKQLGEGKYVKIVIDANRNNLQKLREISKSRGTSIDELLTSYDIQNT